MSTRSDEVPDDAWRSPELLAELGRPLPAPPKRKHVATAPTVKPRRDPLYAELLPVGKHLHMMLGEILFRLILSGHIKTCADCRAEVDLALDALADSHRLHPDWPLPDGIRQEILRRAADA
jgi:hypothetical protein